MHGSDDDRPVPEIFSRAGGHVKAGSFEAGENGHERR
jgi:hypothetical protein